MQKIISQLVFFSDSIFTGLKFIVPVIMVITIFKIPVKKVILKRSIDSLCKLMLIGNIIFIFILASGIYSTWYMQNEAEKALFISFATGPHWYQLFIPIFSYAVLPLFLWKKSFRQTIYPLFIIIMFWLISFYLSDYFTSLEDDPRHSRNTFDWNEYFLKTAICTGLFGLVYIFNSIRRKARIL